MRPSVDQVSEVANVALAFGKYSARQTADQRDTRVTHKAVSGRHAGSAGGKWMFAKTPIVAGLLRFRSVGRVLVHTPLTLKSQFKRKESNYELDTYSSARSLGIPTRPADKYPRRD